MFMKIVHTQTDLDHKTELCKAASNVKLTIWNLKFLKNAITSHHVVFNMTLTGNTPLMSAHANLYSLFFSSQQLVWGLFWFQVIAKDKQSHSAFSQCSCWISAESFVATWWCGVPVWETVVVSCGCRYFCRCSCVKRINWEGKYLPRKISVYVWTWPSWQTHTVV